MNKIDCIKKTDEMFTAKRSAAKQKQAAHIAEIAEKIPEIQRIEKELKALSAQFFSRALEKDFPEEDFVEIKTKSLDMQRRIAELLYEAGYPIDYLEIKYECPECEDNGFIGEKMCGCYRKALSEAFMSCSSMKSVYRDRNFKNYDLTFFEGEDKDKMKTLLDYCKKYASSFSLKSPNLIMMGRPGCGKTYLSCAIGAEVTERGNFVIYTPVQDMIDVFEAVKFGKDSEADTTIYTDCDLLIIDDLGTEFMTQFSENILYNVINDRLNLSLPTIINTNYTGEDIQGMYHDRLTSRIVYEFVKLPFCQKDIRHEKEERKVKRTKAK